MNKPITKIALLSVSDKTGILDLARALQAQGYTLLSTGGTARHLQEHAIPVTEVSDYTNFPEMMQGRLKTLHPKVFGGILGRLASDQPTMDAHDIVAIDFVVVNLYPFEKVTQSSDVTLSEAIENIDIGGPSLLRAAAKNHERVTVLVDPTDYPCIISTLEKSPHATDLSTRYALAQKVFAHTAAYDHTIHQYFRQSGETTPSSESRLFPNCYQPIYTKKQDLRYGENPHQKAAFYAMPNPPTDSIAASTLHQGKPLSFNNIADADAALTCVKSLDTEKPSCVILKHNNPCGVATAASLSLAYQGAFATDKTSAFGGIIAFNQTLDAATATQMLAQQFLELVLAPSIDPAALTVLGTKPNIRVLTYTPNPLTPFSHASWHHKHVEGGLLVQENNSLLLRETTYQVVTQKSPTPQQEEDLLFAWKVAKHVKSNAIVIVKNQTTLGIGAGQMSRIDSIKIAKRKAEEAGLELRGAVMSSDGFFPFADSIAYAAESGITAVIQPGGSINDAAVIDLADQLGLCMLCTGIRHFSH